VGESKAVKLKKEVCSHGVLSRSVVSLLNFSHHILTTTPSTTMSTRGGGRQSMSELKLRRLLEHNQRLKEDLGRPRLKVSEASAR
jgi:hypothetical protein